MKESKINAQALAEKSLLTQIVEIITSYMDYDTIIRESEMQIPMPLYDNIIRRSPDACRYGISLNKYIPFSWIKNIINQSQFYLNPNVPLSYLENVVPLTYLSENYQLLSKYDIPCSWFENNLDRLYSSYNTLFHHSLINPNIPLSWLKNNEEKLDEYNIGSLCSNSNQDILLWLLNHKLENISTFNLYHLFRNPHFPMYWLEEISEVDDKVNCNINSNNSSINSNTKSSSINSNTKSRNSSIKSNNKIDRDKKDDKFNIESKNKSKTNKRTTRNSNKNNPELCSDFKGLASTNDYIVKNASNGCKGKNINKINIIKLINHNPNVLHITLKNVRMNLKKCAQIIIQC